MPSYAVTVTGTGVTVDLTSTAYEVEISQLGTQGPQGDDGPQGDKGWAPEFSVVTDGDRRVLQVVDWVGGEGTKPDTGDYVGASGLVSLIASAVDIRGATGAAGAGSGDMLISVYDPQAISGDAFDTDNHTDGTTNKVYTATEKTKLAGIEAAADVTDTANVTAAGALMDSEVTNLAAVKAFDPAAYATAAQGTSADTAFGWGDHALAGYLTTVAWGAVTGKPSFAPVATSGAYSDLSGIPSTFTPASHTHPLSEVSDWPVAVTATEVGYLDGVTSAIQTQLAAKAPLASPTFTGTPAAPTPTGGDNTTKIATTAFVQSAVSSLIDTAPGTMDTLNEIAAALGDDPNFATTITASIATKLTASNNLSDVGDAATARTNLGVDAAGTDNSTNVTLAGTPDYLTIAGQVITLGQIDLTADVTGDLPVADGGTGASTASAARTNLGAAPTASPTFTGNVTVPEVTETVYNLTGTAVDPANGTVQTLALSANRTLTDSLTTGQAVRLLITGGDTYTVTWPAGIEWVGGEAPTLTAKDLVTLEKIGSDLIGYSGLGVA